MTQNLPSVIYHDLSGIANINELKHAVDAVTEALSQGHVQSIVNAFFVNTKICVNGVPYIKVSSLSKILRTGNSGAERPLVYQGMPGVLSAAEIVVIEGFDHVSGPTLRGLIDTRISQSVGRTKQYLMIAMQSYERIINLRKVYDMKEMFLGDIRNNRALLKVQRIDFLEIKACEFSGARIENIQDFEFAHIESVITNPLLALDVNNGVIILKDIHRQLTGLRIHDFKGMYNFCKDNNYSTDWAG